MKHRQTAGQRLCGRHAALLSLALLVLIAAAPPAHSQKRKYGEYQVKAAFLQHLLKFLAWPPQSAQGRKNHFTICLVGRDPFGEYLAAGTRREVLGRQVFVQRQDHPSDLRDCHLLFISDSERQRLPAILDAVSGAAVVTVGDTPGFAQDGVMINMYLQGDKVRLEINPAAAKKLGIQFGSQLLVLATLVNKP